jgi:hypothetical protein
MTRSMSEVTQVSVLSTGRKGGTEGIGGHSANTYMLLRP